MKPDGKAPCRARRPDAIGTDNLDLAGQVLPQQSRRRHLPGLGRSERLAVLHIRQAIMICVKYLLGVRNIKPVLGLFLPGQTDQPVKIGS